MFGEECEVKIIHRKQDIYCEHIECPYKNYIWKDDWSGINPQDYWNYPYCEEEMINCIRYMDI